MDSNTKLIQKTKRALTAAASLAASAMLARTIINDYLPPEIHTYLSSVTTAALRACLSTQDTIIIREYEESYRNPIFKAAKAYIATKVSRSSPRLLVSISSNSKEQPSAVALSLEKDAKIVDVFQGVHINWLILHQIKNEDDDNDDSGGSGKQRFELTFNRKHKDLVLDAYLPYILDFDRAIKVQGRELTFYMNGSNYWSGTIKLNHPATFDTLAMEPKAKEQVKDDLARFVKRKDYYKRIGKAWKRGYLLYGPPGTGKSSLVAAMANYLKFDIYSLELADVKNNKALQRLMIEMSNKSILLVEDIDCTIDLNNREAEKEEDDGNGDGKAEPLTLSGLLNAVDGLWSCCGEERIIVFTTNYKDKLDPALLRPGRMDMHIHMGYCGVAAFKMLASNYHGVGDHPLFGEIEELIKKVEVTPAEVAEQLMRTDDTEIALKGFIEFLQGKKSQESDLH